MSLMQMDTGPGWRKARRKLFFFENLGEKYKNLGET